MGFIIWLGFIVLTVYIADQKNRPLLEGILLGFFLGGIGTIIELVLPTKPKQIGNGY